MNNQINQALNILGGALAILLTVIGIVIGTTTSEGGGSSSDDSSSSQDETAVTATPTTSTTTEISTSEIPTPTTPTTPTSETPTPPPTTSVQRGAPVELEPMEAGLRTSSIQKAFPDNVYLGSSPTIKVFKRNTTERAQGIWAGFTNNNRNPIIQAQRNAQPGLYDVKIYADGELSAYAILRVYPDQLNFRTLTAGRGYNTWYRVENYGNMYLGADKNISFRFKHLNGNTIENWFAGTYDADKNTIHINVPGNTRIGTYQFEIYSDGMRVAYGNLNVILAPASVKNDPTMDKYVQTWRPLGELKLPNRENISFDDTITWNPTRAQATYNKGMITPGHTFYTFNIINGEQRSSRCSLGWIVSSAGRPYVLTAGHCGSQGQSAYIQDKYGKYIKIGHFVVSSFRGKIEPGMSDFGLIEITRTDLVNPLVDGKLAVRGFVDADALRRQDKICRFGGTSGYVCGSMTGRSWQNNPHMFVAHNISSGGDSGGPVWAVIDGNAYAVGVTSYGPTKMNHDNKTAYFGFQEVEGVLNYYKDTRFYGDLWSRAIPGAILNTSLIP